MPKLVLKPDAMYGISAYKTKWIVILKRSGKSLAKSFAFSTHGGREVALSQAQAWRDEMIHRQPTHLRRELAQKARRDNTSGVPGVSLHRWPDGRPRRWIARTSVEKGLFVTARFSIKRYGYEQAKQLAIAERQKQLQQMEGRCARHPAALVDTAAPTPVAHIQHQPRATITGIVGVAFSRSKVSRKPQSWTALTMVQGKRISKSFSIAKFGNDGARELAIAERQRQLAMRVPVQPIQARVSV